MMMAIPLTVKIAMNFPATALSLNENERERSRILSELISNAIKRSEDQAIPFSQFLQLALYEPHYGYYTSSDNIIGTGGDYITAPELGDTFGKCIARKISQALRVFNKPATVYEFGAGNGKLAIQILKEMERIGVSFQSYQIVEVSKTLRQRQQSLFQREVPWAVDKIEWLSELPQDGIFGVVIANEVLDAMPVEIFKFTNGRYLQAYVEKSGDEFSTVFRNALKPDFKKKIDAMKGIAKPNGYISEFHCQAEAWIRSISETLVQGLLLVIDYGFPEQEYYHPDRSEGTLVCHRRHYVHHDPYICVGCQDISTHVNFSGIASIAIENGMKLNGYTSLGAFLLELGLLDLSRESSGVESIVKMNQQVLTLTSPSEMGELFKVMELTKNLDSDRTGFQQFDRSNRL